MVPGGGAMHLNDSLGRNASLEWVGTLHEQAAAIAAEGYAKATGGLGAVCVTTGPGGTNALTGIAGAWLDSAPVLVVSGQVKRADLTGARGVRQMGVQEVDIVSMVRPITKYAVTVLDPAEIRYHLEKAIHLAKHGRPGPVWVDVPLDVQASTIDPDKLQGYEPPGRPGPGGAVEEGVAKVVGLLEKAERPVLLVGNGVRAARAQRDLRALIDLLGVPVLATWLSFDMIPHDHPLYAGRPGSVAPRYANFAVQNCDLLIAVGARLDNTVTNYDQTRFAPHARKAIVDIDAAELGKITVPVDVPLQADAGDFLRELTRQWDGRGPVACEAWRERVRRWKDAYPVVTSAHRERSGPVSIYALADVVSEALQEGETVVNGSSGSGIEIFLHAFRHKEGQRFIFSPALGAMGYGLPMAVGVCLAGGRRRLVLIDGDGGFQLNVQELETVRRLDLPIKMFVLDNQGYASIRASQKGYFGRLVGADATSGLSLPELSRVADCWRIPFRRIDDQRDLAASVPAALDAPGPELIQVVVIPDEERVPRTTSRVLADGSMASSPMEDLYPPLPRDELEANMTAPPPGDYRGTRPRGTA